MTSYLAEVLSSSEKMEIEQINLKCPEVSSRLEICRCEVLNYLDNIYVRFTERPKENKILASKVKQLEEDITCLVTNVEKITKKELEEAGDVMDKNKKNLQRVELSIRYISSLYKVHEGLMKVQELKEDKLYLECVEKMIEIDSFIDGLDESKKLEVVDEIKWNLNREKDDLLDALTHSLEEQIIFETDGNVRKFKVSCDIDVLKSDLTTLYFANGVIPYLAKVGGSLLQFILIPLTQQTCLIEVKEEKSFGIFEVRLESTKDTCYEDLYSNLKTLIEFFDNYVNIKVCEDLSPLGYIGKEIFEELSNSIILNCLEKTIPETKEELQGYSNVIQATEELENLLKVSQFFPEDFSDLSNFVKNVDMLFIEKKCKKYNSEAISIMKKDLHDLTEVGKLYSETFQIKDEFPQCSISRNVIELLNYLEKIISEAETLSNKSVAFLLNTVKNICLSYVSFVPEHHKKLLQTIPQQIAVFYNNCNYISHVLTSWDQTILKKLPIPYHFEDTGFQIRDTASDKFTSYIDTQTKQIQTTLKAPWPSELILRDVPKPIETSIRQCLRQQELLKTVWQKVLPHATYSRTLGAILDAFCAQLVASLLRYEDIHSDAAEKVVELLKMVQGRAPKLFSDGREVAMFAGNWYKLNELVFVLGASLVDIDDRWADGKGPLAMQFKGEEVRRLVKALFQDTERRAAVLGRMLD